MSIYIMKANVTIEMRIQGGINAANEFTNIFMVHSVSAITHTKKVSRDDSSLSGGYSGSKNSAHTFSKVLEEQINEHKAPTQCHTITYGNDLRLRNFLYQTREYQY